MNRAKGILTQIALVVLSRSLKRHECKKRDWREKGGRERDWKVTVANVPSTQMKLGKDR